MYDTDYLRGLSYLYDALDSGASTSEFLEAIRTNTLALHNCQFVGIAERTKTGSIKFIERNFGNDVQFSAQFEASTKVQSQIDMALVTGHDFFYEDEKWSIANLILKANAVWNKLILVIAFPSPSILTEACRLQLQLIRRVLVTTLNSSELGQIESATPIQTNSGVNLSELSSRQKKIAALLKGGRTNKEIARTLSYSESTIRYEIIRLYQTLQVRNRAAAAALLSDYDEESYYVGMQYQIRVIQQTRVIGYRGEFIGVMSPFSNAAQVLPSIWSTFFTREPEINAKPGGKVFGVMTMEGDATVYIAGVEAAENAQVPFGLSETTIPMGRYLSVTHYGDAATIAITTEKAYREIFPDSGKVMRLAPHLEVYDERFDPDSPTSEMEIWIPIEND